MGFVAFNNIRACALNGNEWQRSLRLLNDNLVGLPFNDHRERMPFISADNFVSLENNF